MASFLSALHYLPFVSKSHSMLVNTESRWSIEITINRFMKYVDIARTPLLNKVINAKVINFKAINSNVTNFHAINFKVINFKFDIAKHLLRILQLSFANWSLPVNILVVQRCLTQTIMTAKNWCYQSPTRIKNQSIIVQRNLEKCTKMADIVRKYGECIVANIGAERRSTKQQITHGSLLSFLIKRKVWKFIR
ncbi:unnamed protein product [Toxocara canis]|uniref:Tick transposon n=1 Tax=Toxocara canis TaxID=6265 RepID=A0A183UYA2_TOXCA|nr:unnamed protein product [Toxocara canis]